MHTKQLWGEGPWQNEPDELEFDYRGYQCRILRTSFTKSLCGYITLPDGHPWASYCDFDDIPCEVHGGLTFKEDLTIGFDCAHLSDLTFLSEGSEQILTKLSREIGIERTYKTIEFVTEEIKSLVDQAIEAANANN